MDQDRIVREIKTILYFSDDITAITLDDIEKRLVECGIIQVEEVSRLKQLIIREFRKQLFLLRKMQINHFVKELQKWFETQTKKRLENRNNQDTHDNQDTEYTEDIKTLLFSTATPKSPFMFFCLQSLKEEFEKTSYNSFPEFMQSLSQKWTFLSTMEKDMYISQFVSFRNIQSVQEEPSEFRREDQGFREFLEMNSTSYSTNSISLSPESQSHLRLLQSLVHQPHHHFNILTIDNPINVINSFENMDNMESLISQISSNDDLSFHVNTINTMNALHSSVEDDVQDQFQSLKQMAFSSPLPCEKHSAHKRKEKKIKKTCKKGDERRKSPYNLFLSHRMKEERTKNKNLSFVTLSTQLSKEWKEMSDQEKLLYSEKAKEASVL